MKAKNLLKPLQFRFVEPDDAAAYGGDWHVYDEAKIARMPVRELMKLEIEMGMSVLDVFAGVRAESVLGYLGGTWLALWLTDPALAGSFESYTPAAVLIEWRAAPVGAEGPEVIPGPLDSTPSPDSPTVA